MAFKGVAIVTNIGYQSASKFRADISYVSIDDIQVDAGMVLEFDVGVSQLTFEAAVKAAVKEVLQGAGVTFQLLDAVRLIGGTL